MKLRLNYWQMLPLFLPLVIGQLIEGLPHRDLETFQIHSAIFNFLLVLNICLVIYYQSFLLLGFIRDSKITSNAYKINTLIPVVFFTLYLLYVGYYTFSSIRIQHIHFKDGPLHRSDFNPITWTILLFLIHTFITYFFVNNQFVAEKIKKIRDVERREQLTIDYRLPMKRLVRFTIWAITGTMLVSVIVELLTMPRVFA